MEDQEQSRMATDGEYKELYEAIKKERDTTKELLAQAFPFVRQSGSQQLINRIAFLLSSNLENGEGINGKTI